jgi:hypothetical protein
LDDLVRVTIVDNEPEARMAIAMLETEGIVATWRQSAFGATSWAVPAIGGTGPIEILVRPDDAARALELLDADAQA